LKPFDKVDAVDFGACRMRIAARILVTSSIASSLVMRVPDPKLQLD
jgi:hypothetical protein